MRKIHWGRIAAVALAGAAIVGAGCAGGGTIPAAQSLSNPNSGVAHKNSSPMTWQLMAGGNRGGEAFQALNFFSDTITIDEGDSVTWTNGGNAHTITFFAGWKKPRQPIGAPYGGSTYDGKVYTSSGFTAPGQTYTLTFPKAGTYPYSCIFHGPEMAGVVIVQPAGTAYPHPQSYYTSQGNAEMNRELDGAVGSLDEFPFADGGTTLAAGIAPGLAQNAPTHSTVLRFVDGDSLGSGTITVPVGTTITWSNQSNNEPHTVTFPRPGHTPPPWLTPGHAPIGGPTYDGSHLTDSGAFFPGQSYSLTFTATGDFTYYCLFHDFVGMIGTVKVQ
jgi:plastocyanin